MVLLHVKKQEDDLFMAEIPADTSMDVVTREVVELHNLRLRVKRLVSACEDLIKHGPIKPEEILNHIDFDKLSISESETNPSADPSGKRVGVPMAEENVETLKKTMSDAEAAISQALVERRQVLKRDSIVEAISNIKGAVMIAYPMGLPPHDPVQMGIEDTEELVGTHASLDVHDPDTAVLWWAGKQLFRDKKLSEFVGKNDKTKVVVKIQKRGAGAPVRESPVTAQQQKEMMAYWYKKQEEAKKLEADEDISYTGSNWANPKGLKSHFNGMGGDISWRPR